MSAAPSLPSFAVRLATPEDSHYILSTWRREEKRATGHAEGAYFATLQDGEMLGILARESTTVTIAYPQGSPETILGWLCARPAQPVIAKGPRTQREIGPAPIVYFLYVREEIRRMDIGRMLLGELVERKDVVYTTRPARERGADGWGPSAVERAIPAAWKYCPRAAFVEIP